MSALTAEQHREVVATIERIVGDPKAISALLGGTQELLADVMHGEAARLRGRSHHRTGGNWDRVHAAADDLVEAITARVEAKANRRAG